MTCGDLFAGIGGMSLGLERAGFTVRWQVEREPFCENVLARHWPDVVRRRDVRFAGAGTLEPVDLIAGGFPCQDISAAGRGVGITGFRSGLWREFARLVRELHPRWVLVENVPTLRRRGADTVLGDLEAAGYACWPLVVGARHIGAPHRRDRVWIVGRVADADVEGSRAERRGGLLDGQRTALGDDADGRDHSGLDDADAGRRWQPDDTLPSGRDRTDRASSLTVGLADGDAAGLEGRCLPRCERAYQWPARPGSPPFDWEPPRTIESSLGRRPHGLSSRLASARWRAELKALGNSVVPQVVEVIGRAILAVAG
jgi:DNA (cytosine-5)-methyltransferase 1